MIAKYCVWLFAALSSTCCAATAQTASQPARCIVGTPLWCIAVGWPSEMRDDGTRRTWTVKVLEESEDRLVIVDSNNCLGDDDLALTKVRDEFTAVSGKPERVIELSIFRGQRCAIEIRYPAAHDASSYERAMRFGILFRGHPLAEYLPN
jgi:hypothetical protein